MRCKLKRRKKGVAGFYEEIPALILIIAGVTVFLISVVHVVSLYLSTVNQENIQDECYSLSRIVRSYDKIMYNGTYSMNPVSGVFDIDKIRNLTNATVLKDLHSTKKFKITIEDLENTTAKWTFGTEIPTPRPSVYAVETTSIVLKDKHDVFHVGRLTVEMW
ncbi:MAG: hypothetical protein N3F63_02650 [Thermoplasmata archaeon]|nr:hypothetical protein [Thermoplasmata archaeon]